MGNNNFAGLGIELLKGVKNLKVSDTDLVSAIPMTSSELEEARQQRRAKCEAEGSEYIEFNMVPLTPEIAEKMSQPGVRGHSFAFGFFIYNEDRKVVFLNDDPEEYQRLLQQYYGNEDTPHD